MGDEVGVGSGWLVDVGVRVGGGVHVAVGSGRGVLEGSGVGTLTSVLVAGGVAPLQAIRNSKAQGSRPAERDRIVFMCYHLTWTSQKREMRYETSPLIFPLRLADGRLRANDNGNGVRLTHIVAVFDKDQAQEVLAGRERVGV